MLNEVSMTAVCSTNFRSQAQPTNQGAALETDVLGAIEHHNLEAGVMAGKTAVFNSQHTRLSTWDRGLPAPSSTDPLSQVRRRLVRRALIEVAVDRQVGCTHGLHRYGAYQRLKA